MKKLLLGITIENLDFTKYVQTFSLSAIFSVFFIPYFLIFYKIKKSNLLNTFLILIVWFLISTIFKIIFRFENKKFYIRIL
jgi:hypothetical protein